MSAARSFAKFEEQTAHWQLKIWKSQNTTRTETDRTTARPQCANRSHDEYTAFSRGTMSSWMGGDDGAAVDGIADRLGRRAASRRRPASEAPVRLAVLFSGNGFHCKEWWAKGEGKQMELGKVLAPLADFREKMLFVRGLYNEEALKGNIHSSQTGNLLSGAPLASGGEIRSGTSIDQLLAQTLRPLDQGAEPGARLREVEPVGPQELLDALQLAHLVELRRPRRRRWSSIPRWPSTGCSRTTSQQGDKSVLDAVLADATDLAPQDQRQRPAQARRIPRLGPRRRAAHRERRQEGRAARLAADARQAEHAAPGRRHPAGHRRAHAADVRHPRARLPDRHDAHLHAQAQQRPLLAAVPATSAWTT